MKQLRFVILIMLIMLLLCPAARAAQTPGCKHRTNGKTSCIAGGFLVCIYLQNRSSTTFSGGTSSREGLCMNIFMYLNDEA